MDIKKEKGKLMGTAHFRSHKLTKLEIRIKDVEYIKEVLEKIPAFGDSIGNNVSKAQIGIALNKTKSLLKELS